MNYFVGIVDTISKRNRSNLMAKVRSRGNASTELKAARIFREYGITGWRRHLPIAGRPDFAFQKARLALFIDGCFWHGCSRCYRAPKSSRVYWQAKVERNKERDRQVSRQLRKDGWKVVRVRECELKTPTVLLRKIRNLG